MAIALIPARGGSVGVPFKNIRKVGDIPLIAWTIRAALESGVFTHVYVSSDSDQILKISEEYGAIPCLRSAEASSSSATTESVIMEFLTKNLVQFDILCLIQATSPFTTGDDLKDAYSILKNSDANSLLSVVRSHKFIWRLSEAGHVAPLNYDPAKRPRRQDWDGELIENGAFYMIKSNDLNVEFGVRLAKKIIHYEMDEKNSLEIDTELDLLMCDTIARALQRDTSS